MNRAASALKHIRGVRASIVALLVIVVMMPLISLWATFQVSKLSNRITTVDNARLAFSRAFRYMLDEESALRGYTATKEVLFLQPYRDADPRMRQLLATLPGAFQRAGLYDVLPKLQDFERLHDEWHRNVASKLLADPTRRNALQVEETSKAIVDRMRTDSASIHTEAASYTNRASHQMFEVMIISGLLSVLWIGIVGTFTIMFERRAMQREMELVVSLVEEREAVERLSDWRSRLLAMLAHDFKSQLAVIIGAAHLLEDFPQRRGDPELLASVRSSGYTLAEMADNAILLARAQERRLVLQRSAFDISEIVNTVVQRYGVQRAFNVYREMPTAMIDGDRSYVTRVMDNIIGNAVKYSEHPVDVHIGEEHDKIRVSVTDRGIGISDVDLPHIFEEFWRSENMQWSKRGSGVGLFIVKQIMEAHDGSIRVESELGKGTTVTLRFQRALTAFTAEVPAAPETLKTGT
jgi:signal transduction histidine kinase